MTILHLEIWTNVTAKENTAFDALKGVVEFVMKSLLATTYSSQNLNQQSKKSMLKANIKDSI